SDAEGKNHSRIKIVGEHVEFNPVALQAKSPVTTATAANAIAEPEPVYFEEAYPPELSGGQESP
ncbi:MAG: hypothetical protein LBK13_11410, partial [Spirochaetales bacterium]|nr:hypothetical protein [Spirochaetales bacterium]